ncbi:MAG: dipeptidase [Candidatus Asgardarchaeia archaeon]
MKVIDLHHDLALRLREQFYASDFKKIDEASLMKAYNDVFYLVLTAVFTPKTRDTQFHEVYLSDPFREAVSQIIFYNHLIDRHNQLLAKVESFSDYERIKGDGKTGFLYHLEGVYGVSSIDDFEALYNLGIRSFSLTWNISNEYGCSCKDKKDLGLTSRGEDIINFALDKNMLIDLAHLSEKTALDILDIADKNVFVSHTGLRPLTDITRNVSEKVIERVVDRKGVIGIIFHKGMLNNEKCKDPIDCFILHLNYIVDNYGIDYVCFGSDFYGILPSMSIYSKTTEVEDVKDVLSMLSDYFTKSDLEKIAYLNFERFLKDSLI